MARRTKWKKGKVFYRKMKKRDKMGSYVGSERGRWEYPNGKKKGRRWRKV